MSSIALSGSRKGSMEVGVLFCLQIVCAVSAVASLPPGAIHPCWIATFVLPSALFLYLGTGRRASWIPIWLRLLFPAALLAAGAIVTYEEIGALGEKSQLACSLLPLLSYFTLRREPTDASLSLFFSFCFLLIGIMLNEDTADWTLLVYLAASAWALQIESKNRALALRHAARGRTPLRTTRILGRLHVLLAIMLVAFLLHSLIYWVPSPGDQAIAASPGVTASNGDLQARNTGLSHSFDLTGAEGSPIHLGQDRIIEVSGIEGDEVPTDLYLRMAHFDRAHLSRWITAPFELTRRHVQGRLVVRRGSGDLERRFLRVTRVDFEPHHEYFLPPGVLAIAGISDIEYHRNSGYFRSPSGRDRTYDVAYTRPHLYAGRGDIDIDLITPDHTTIPAGLDNARIRSLARQLRGDEGLGLSDMVVAERLADRLRGRCRYALREPVGPYADPIQDFLFGSREGYCMHFSTALAVLLRTLDIPCRIAVGFHAGKPVEGRSGVRAFGSQNAHAWVELPMAGPGWTLIDPTPASSRGGRGWPEAETPNPSLVTPARSAGACALVGLLPFLAEYEAFLTDPLAHPGTLLSLITAALVLTVGVLFVLARRQRSEPGSPAATRPSHDHLRARRSLEQILRALRRAGYPKNGHWTLQQFLQALHRPGTDPRLDLESLRRGFVAYQEVRFGGRPLDHSRQDDLRDAIEAAER